MGPRPLALLLAGALALGACRFDVDHLKTAGDGAPPGADGPILPGADGTIGLDGSPTDARPAQDGETLVSIWEDARVADVHLDESEPATRFGADLTLMVRGQNPHIQTLIRFDLNAVPAGADITEARLDLWVGSESSETLSIHPVTMPWVEDEATYLEASAGQGWPPGGVPVDLGSELTLDAPVDNVLVSVPLTAWVREWHAGVRANHGILFSLGSNQQANFASSENSGFDGPTLVVRYR